MKQMKDPSKDPPCPSLKGRELFSPFKGELEGSARVRPDQSGLKIRPHRNYWAYLPNNLPKNVVPLQRNFKNHRTCPGTSRPVGAKITPSRNYW